jgi:hypothetical protein
MSFICLLGSCCYGLITSVPILPRKKKRKKKRKEKKKESGHYWLVITLKNSDKKTRESHFP